MYHCLQLISASPLPSANLNCTSAFSWSQLQNSLHLMPMDQLQRMAQLHHWIQLLLAALLHLAALRSTTVFSCSELHHFLQLPWAAHFLQLLCAASHHLEFRCSELHHFLQLLWAASHHLDAQSWTTSFTCSELHTSFSCYELHRII